MDVCNDLNGEEIAGTVYEKYFKSKNKSNDI